jgi:hypothetical protein
VGVAALAAQPATPNAVLSSIAEDTNWAGIPKCSE